MEEEFKKRKGIGRGAMELGGYSTNGVLLVDLIENIQNQIMRRGPEAKTASKYTTYWFHTDGMIEHVTQRLDLFAVVNFVEMTTTMIQVGPPTTQSTMNPTKSTAQAI